MARELLTSWGEFQSAADRLLALAEREILIYDHDLARLQLDASFRQDYLRRLLQPGRADCLRIALRETALVQRTNPRLMRLLADHPTGMTMVKTPDHLAHLRDAMILVDGRHGLVLFDQDQPRSKLLTDEGEELEPYCQRFEEIRREGGTPVSPTTLGL
ncbi:MAG: hypothetical protein H6R10_2782 [Rhodocyclaceae bacterium]|nr:hypothetical protein [Rhodocyclaceae bacterium]